MNDRQKEIASEMHRWGRMTGAFSIIAMVTWLVLESVSSASSASPALGAVKSGLLWPGVVLAILAAIGLFGGFGFDYLAGHKR